MAGTNPYQASSEVRLPGKPYRLTIEPIGVSIEVDPASLPASGEGRPGSLLDIALAHGVELDHACGGVCACSTCHVIVRRGIESCQPASEDEEDMLDRAPGIELTSRLACQAVPDGSSAVVIAVPGWNRNHARESH